MARPRKAVATAPALNTVTAVPSGNLIPVQELTEADKMAVSSLQRALSRSNLGSNNPLWDDQTELGLMQSASYTGRVRYEDQEAAMKLHQ
jgi:hypothetical protein